MQPSPRAPWRRILVPAVMMIVGSYGVDRAAAQNEPAEVILLGRDTSSAADWLLGLDPRPQVLVAGGDQGKVLAIVLGNDINDANKQLEALRVEEVAECTPEGVTCCDENAHVWVIDSALQKERFWLRLGEYCEPSPVQEGRTDDEPSNAEPGVPVTRAPPDIWQDLARLGVTQPLMTLAASNQQMRLLADPSWQNSGLSPPRHIGLRTLSPIILVDHVNPNTRPPGPARPPGGCATGDYCRSYLNRRCYADRHDAGTEHAARHHWYVKTIDGNWCEQVDKCNCS